MISTSISLSWPVSFTSSKSKSSVKFVKPVSFSSIFKLNRFVTFGILALDFREFSLVLYLPVNIIVIGWKNSRDSLMTIISYDLENNMASSDLSAGIPLFCFRVFSHTIIVPSCFSEKFTVCRFFLFYLIMRILLKRTSILKNIQFV